MNLESILGSELYSQVVDKLGGKKIMIDDGNFIPKNRFDQVNIEKKELKEQVDTLNKTLQTNNKDLENLKKSSEASEELKKQIQEYQDKMSNTQKEFSEQLKAKETEWSEKEVSARKSYAVREKLLMENADPKYMDLLMQQIDLSKISESEGKFIGVDDVIATTKTTFEKLFDKPVTIGTGIANGGTSIPNQDLQALAEKAKSGKMEDRVAYSLAKRQAENKEE